MSEKKSYLIVGASSEAGQSAIEALREFHQNDGGAHIIGTASKADATVDSIQNIDAIIPGIDLNDGDAAGKIQKGLGEFAQPGRLAAIFFTPAFGPIGYPIRAATLADADKAIAFSFTPMQALADAVQPGLCIGYSAFYWLPHAAVGYGSMAYAKVLLDTIAHQKPARFRAIRGGTFRSPATRGIGLLLQRSIKNTPHAELIELGAKYKESGGKFSEFFFDFAWSTENTAFGKQFDTPHRPTDRAGLKAATLRILNGAPEPVQCVIGDWLWGETDMPPLDGAVFQIKDEVYKKYGF